MSIQPQTCGQVVVEVQIPSHGGDGTTKSNNYIYSPKIDNRQSRQFEQLQVHRYKLTHNCSRGLRKIQTPDTQFLLPTWQEATTGLLSKFSTTKEVHTNDVNSTTMSDDRSNNQKGWKRKPHHQSNSAIHRESPNQRGSPVRRSTATVVSKKVTLTLDAQQEVPAIKR